MTMESLTKKWHGVPVWAWAVGALLVAYLGYRWYSKRSSAQSNIPQGGVTNSPFDTPSLGGGSGSSPPPIVGTTSAVDPISGNVVDSTPVADTSGYTPDQFSGVVTPLDPMQWYGPNSGATQGGPNPLYAYSSIGGQQTLVGESPGLGSVFSVDQPASVGYNALGFQPSDNITFVPTPINPANAPPVPIPIKGTRLSVV